MPDNMYITQQKSRIIADMHTHSLYSHDSECPVEDMCLAQLEAGTNIFAVTDHISTPSSETPDSLMKYREAFNTITELREKYKDKCLILAGIEIGEFIRSPQEAQELITRLPYDVIITSLHHPLYKGKPLHTSIADFSKIPQKDIDEIIDTYFEDLLTTVETTDFDILAHITYPLRYIVGIYKREADLRLYDGKITAILKALIAREKSLEVNTSSYNLLNDFMPGRNIIKKYYDLGGRLITLGSDAHTTANASLQFDTALKFLKETGFEQLYYYRNRKAVGYDI